MKRIACLVILLVLGLAARNVDATRTSSPRSLLAAGAQKLHTAETCVAEFVYEIFPDNHLVAGKIYLKKPNFVHSVWTVIDGPAALLPGGVGPRAFVQHDDGVRGIQWSSDRGLILDTTNRDQVDRILKGTSSKFGNLEEFFDPNAYRNLVSRRASLRQIGEVRIGDTECAAIEVSEPRSREGTHILYAGPDGILRGWTSLGPGGGDGVLVRSRVLRLTLNEPIPEDVLNWTPPRASAGSEN